ncbi:MAG TPA: RHS repeat-associated core domain-containing protein, partial [Burkholderiaceae bacterium]|nr:RHS repeat-associated core domain-containing protein [Burkholderiaceae bacterium]
MTRKDRTVLWQAGVGEYGQADVAQGSSIEMPLRASNQYFDAETGLHYNIHRYLDARQGSYISPDPLGLAAGPDLYRFGLGQPHRFVDPSGLAPIRSNADVPTASFADRLQYVFEKAAEKYPGDVGDALKDLVSPTSLASTAGLFSIWAVAQTTPVGWAADVLLAGIGYAALGEAIYTVLDTFVTASIKIYDAKCLSDLDGAAGVLGKGLASATVGIGTSAAIAGAPKIASLIRQVLKKAPAGKLPAVKEPTPPPAVPLATLESLEGKQLFGPRLSNVAKQNDGRLGEQIAKQILEAETGGKFRSLQNGSGNGADLIRINSETKTIEHIEVKSSQTGNPGRPKGDPNERFNTWILQAANQKKIAGKNISSEDQMFAQTIERLMGDGYRLDNKVMQVIIPKPGSSGTPIAQLFPWQVKTSTLIDVSA